MNGFPKIKEKTRTVYERDLKVGLNGWPMIRKIDDDSFINAMKEITDWLGLYVASESKYNGGLWVDNGTAKKDAVVKDGLTPLIQTWINGSLGKKAVVFSGSNSLRIALSSDNYNLFNTKNTVVFVGQYDGLTAVNQPLLSNGNFLLTKEATENWPEYKDGQFGVFYAHNINHTGIPFILIAHATLILDGSGNERVLIYLNGDIGVRTNYTSKSFGEVLIGKNSTNFLTGKVANIAISQSQLKTNQLKQVIRNVQGFYKIVDESSYHISFVGDSLTYGVNNNDVDTYPAKLLSSLETTYSPVVFRYSNTAISGSKYAGIKLAARNNEDLLSFANEWTVNKRMLIVWLGTNDIALDGKTDTQVLDDAIEFVTDRLKSGFKKIVICTIIDRTTWTSNPTLGTYRSDFNTALKAYDFSTLEAFYGADVRVAALDEETELSDYTDTTYFQGDGIHLTTAGNQIVADVIDAIIDSLVSVNLSDDTTRPEVDSVFLNVDNSFIDITLTKGCHSDEEGLQPVLVDSFNIFDFSASGASGISILSVKRQDSVIESLATPLLGNENKLRIFIKVIGSPDGTETFKIGASNIYDVFGNRMIDESASLTLNAALANATLNLLSGSGGAGVSITGNQADFVEGGGGVGARITQTLVESTETVPDDDFVVEFKIGNDSDTSTGSYAIGVGQQATAFSTNQIRHCLGKNNSSSLIRVGELFSSNSSSGVTLDQNDIFRFVHTKLPSRKISLQRSSDGGETWSIIKDYTGTEVDAITFPSRITIGADLFAGQGNVRFYDIKLSANFS